MIPTLGVFTDLNLQPWQIALVLAVAGLLLLFFALRLWLALTRPPSLRDIPTPTLDQLNARALSRMSSSTPQDEQAALKKVQDEPAPADLLDVVPPEGPPPPKKV